MLEKDRVFRHKTRILNNHCGACAPSRRSQKSKPSHVDYTSSSADRIRDFGSGGSASTVMEGRKDCNDGDSGNGSGGGFSNSGSQ